jgi:hypothetical protein
MENVRKHKDFELVDQADRMRKLLNKPMLKSFTIINEHLVGVEKMKKIVKLDKPIYVGFSILELSKLHMYEFYYDVLKKKYGDKLRLLQTDTDSLITYIETEDVYKDFKEMGEHFDFSDYAKEHPNYDVSNKKVIGKFKDEVNGNIILEHVGLKPKMYAQEIDAEKAKDRVKKVAKGVPKHKVKRNIHFENYKDALFNNTKHYVSFNCIRSTNHCIQTLACTKIDLNNYDNKRYYTDNINSLPYGHYLTR